MLSPEHLAEMKAVCSGVEELTEGGQVYLHLPALKLPGGCNPGVLDALMALHQHSGYPTRLFLAQRVQGRGQNWTVHHVLGRTWHTWSWNYVKADRRPAEVLAEHLRGLR
jgi:hypothetical protein